MRAYRSFNRYDSSQPFWQWIAAIANNYCIDLLRQRTRTTKLFGDEDTELAQLESPDKQVLTELIDAQDADAVNTAIAQLQDKYRVPLVLAYYNDSSYEEIATDLSISRSHVGVLLLRAKQLLMAGRLTSGCANLLKLQHPFPHAACLRLPVSQRIFPA